MTSQAVNIQDRRRLPFVMVTKAAIEEIRSRFEKRRGPMALSIYMALVDCANDARGETFEVSRRELAERGMVSLRSLEDYLPELVAAGLVLVEASGQASGKANIWTLTDPPSCGTAAAAVPPLLRQDLPQPVRYPGDVKKNKKKSPSSEGDGVRVFDEWVKATGLDPARTQLTDDRRRRIEKALASHGLDDCMKAVCNIGRDPWARGKNDRNTRFDDVSHALGSAERIERWRDWTPAAASTRSAQSERDAAALDGLMGAEA